MIPNTNKDLGFNLCMLPVSYLFNVHISSGHLKMLAWKTVYRN